MNKKEKENKKAIDELMQNKNDENLSNDDKLSIDNLIDDDKNKVQNKRIKVLLYMDKDLKENFKNVIAKKGIINFSQGVRLAMNELIEKEK